MQSSAHFWTWKLNSSEIELEKNGQLSWANSMPTDFPSADSSNGVYNVYIETVQTYIRVDKRRLISMEIRSSFHKLIKTFCIHVDERYQLGFYAYVNWVFLNTDNISPEVLNIQRLRLFFISLSLCFFFFGSSVYDPSSDSFNSSICTCTLKLPVSFFILSCSLHNSFESVFDACHWTDTIRSHPS